MLLPSFAHAQSPLEAGFNRRLFTRRDDLTPDIRLLIATITLHAMMIGSWGVVSGLAVEYCISRTFIYALAAQLREAGGFIFDEATHLRQDLSLRAQF